MRRALVLALLAFAVLVARADAAPPPTVTPGVLTVGVSMPSEGFQVGVAAGSRVVYARGLEIDLAGDLARRLELPPQASFLQGSFDALLAPGAKPWDVALAQISVTAARRANVDLSVPYLRVDQGVLVSQFLRAVPRTAAALRGLRLCALRGTTGAEVIAKRIRPTATRRLLGATPTMLLDLQTGRCDAVVDDLPVLAALKGRAPRSYGPIAGLIRTGEQYAVALPKGSPLTPRVDAAITAARADGTISKLRRRWLDLDLSKIRTISTAR
jgi:polar amino acid transport system substrate-binding protein